MQAWRSAQPDLVPPLRVRHKHLLRLRRWLIPKSVPATSWPISLLLQPPSPPLVRTPARPGRNEPCPWGSGKKFKRCCGATRPWRRGWGDWLPLRTRKTGQQVRPCHTHSAERTQRQQRNHFTSVPFSALSPLREPNLSALRSVVVRSRDLAYSVRADISESASREPSNRFHQGTRRW